MWEKIKKFLIGFCAFATPFLTPFNFIFNVLKIDKLIVMYYVFAIILLFYGMCELSGKRKDRKQTKYKAKAKQTIDFAMQPEIQARKMVNIIQFVKKGIKTMIRLLKTYKGAIVAVLTFIVTLIEAFTNFAGEIFVVNGYNILTITGLIISFILALVSYGAGSPQLKEAMANLKKELKLEKENVTTGDVTKYVKHLIKENEKQIANIETKYAKELKTLDIEYAKVEKDYAMGYQLGMVSNELQVAHSEYVQAKKELDSEYQNALNEAKNTNLMYKDKLNQIINNSAVVEH